jgi:alpha-D-ribose 1-methylphosphonate 5-triphosphate diphosphatase PhnM
MRRSTRRAATNLAVGTGIMMGITTVSDMIAIDIMNGGPKKRLRKAKNVINGLAEKGAEAIAETGHNLKKTGRKIEKKVREITTNEKKNEIHK